MTAFVQGPHEYFVPVNAARDENGRGRAQTWDWPESVHEITLAEARATDFDVVVMQRPVELFELAPEWLGSRRLGCDVPAVYLEHNTPPGPVSGMDHPAANRDDLMVVHCTHCNALFWDTGSTPTRVILNGVVDPGYRYTGVLPRLTTVINDAARRGRATGTDLLDRFRAAAPVDLFGLNAPLLNGYPELGQDELHDALARRRVFLHPNRWTSLSLALMEAMHLGLPVVAVATTEVCEAVPSSCGIVTNDLDALVEGARHLIHEPERARAMGTCARLFSRQRHGLDRFLADWDALLKEVAV
jgi:glycosyltransferase involved in cell wall biosynthesis